MNNNVLSIIKNLVSFQTVYGNDAAIHNCFEYINKELSFYPFVVKKYIENGVESWVWSTTKNKHTTYILNAHIDVVPGSEAMFEVKQNSDKIYGRGVSDMKFSVALYIEVLKKIYKKDRKLPSLAIMLTSDEERGGASGVGYLVNKMRYSADVVIIPDGGEDNHIVEQAKGVLHLLIETSGRGAHAARLWEGKNAIDMLIAQLTKIRSKYPMPKKPIWKTTLNIGKINGGIQTNQVADHAEVFIDIRYIPKTQVTQLVSEIKKLVSDSKVSIIVQGDAFTISRENVYIQKWANLLNANQNKIFIQENIASDGRYFSAKNIPVIVSKPVGGLIHSPGEWTSLSSVESFGKTLEQFLAACK